MASSEVRSYGAIAASGPVPTARRAVWARRAAAVVALLAVAAGTLAALSVSRARARPLTELVGLAGKSATEKLLKVSGSPSPPASSGLENHAEPTADTFAAMRPAAEEFMRTIGLDPANVKDDTDIDESCGVFMVPCLAATGACLEQHVSTNAGGEVTVGAEACNCFAAQMAEDVDISSDSDVAVRCDWTCLASIKDVTKEFISSKNGHTGPFCDNTFAHMADKEYGNENGVILEADDTDVLQHVSLTDAKVVEAGDVLMAYVNHVRAHSCSIKPRFDKSPTMALALEALVGGGRHAFHIEAAFESPQETFHAVIAHLPKDKQVYADVKGDPKNLLGRFEVVEIHPKPCAEGDESQLSTTMKMVKSINAQQLSWKASFNHKKHFGTTVAADRARGRLGGGHIQPSEKEIKRFRQTLSTVGFNPPKEYRTSDTRIGDVKCRAYDVRDQGGCGSCYAFAATTAFSARMCHKTGGKWNIVQSPQESIDCNNGCDGGNALSLWDALADEKSTVAVENFCDPYTGEKSTCGGFCSNGNTYSGVKGTVAHIGDASADGIKQIQMEVMKNGPAYISYMIYSDFNAYVSGGAKGVYAKSEGATQSGGHAVTLVGWGEEDGTPYWLLQNSWGADSGDAGYVKIRRGTDECNIESWGITVVQPETPSVCPNTVCKNNARILKDCACSCTGGWSGADCGTCALSCKNGGVLADDCSRCKCAPGFSGIDCGSGFTVTPLAECAATGTLVVSWDFAGDEKPPGKKTVIAVFDKNNFAWGGWTQVFRVVYWFSYVLYLPTYRLTYVLVVQLDAMCGWENSGSERCPASGSKTFSFPATDGEHIVAVIPWELPNEFGQGAGWFWHGEKHIVAKVTALPASACTAASKAAAATANSPATTLAKQEAADEASEKAKQAAMDSRLDAAEGAQSALDQAEASDAGVVNELELAGVDAANPIMWGGAPPIDMCWTIKPSQNANPKAMVAFVGDGSSGSYYPTGINGAGYDQPLAEEAQGCVKASMSTGIPAGVYTIKVLQKGGSAWAQRSVYVAQSTVSFSGYAYNTAMLQLTVSWTITPDVASTNDNIEIYNSKGEVVSWFYTSSGTTDPGTEAKSSGSVQITIHEADGHPKGGFDAGFFPNNAANSGGWVQVANAPDWINWGSIGW